MTDLLNQEISLEDVPFLAGHSDPRTTRLCDRRQIFQGERMTAALLDRLTHHCEIFEMNSESFRFRESMKEQKKSRQQI